MSRARRRRAPGPLPAPVPATDRLGAGDRGQHALTAAGIAREQVWLDESRDDADVCVEVGAVQPDFDPAMGGEEVAMRGAVACVVVDDAELRRARTIEHRIAE